jgi:hypothetical protein
MDATIKAKSNATAQESNNRQRLTELLHRCPIPKEELLANLPLFLYRQNLSTLLFMIQLYQKILEVHGVIMEFGVRWGRNLALFQALRGILEPFNHNRTVIGFDTFQGFPSVDAKDGKADIISVGSYSVTERYEEYLAEVLQCHEKENPIPNIQKYKLIKGDATVEVQKYLKDNPQTIVAFAYFDFDLYEPTKKCLEAIRPHLTKGSVLGFDELNVKDYPGETVAVREVLGLDRYPIRRTALSPTQSYLVIE